MHATVRGVFKAVLPCWTVEKAFFPASANVDLKRLTYPGSPRPHIQEHWVDFQSPPPPPHKFSPWSPVACLSSYVCSSAFLYLINFLKAGITIWLTKFTKT